MFKYFKEIREFKKSKLRGEVILLNSLCNIVTSIEEIIENANDITELAKTLQGATPEEVVNSIVNKIDKTNNINGK